MKLKLLMLAIMLKSVGVCYAMEKRTDDVSVIAGASYYILSGNEHNIVKRPSESSDWYVLFYNAFGDELARVNKAECSLCRLDDKLDPHAPKPQPVAYRIHYWPGIDVGYRSGKLIGKPGYFMVFLDKHRNYIRSYRYDDERRKVMHFAAGVTGYLDSITELKDLDTSIACEEGSYRTRDPRVEDRRSENTGDPGYLRRCVVQ